MPVPMLKVETETPLSLQGETAERLSPVPKATSNRLNAAGATAPTANAAKETPGYTERDTHPNLSKNYFV
jgi:hypothetical protein